MLETSAGPAATPPPRRRDAAERSSPPAGRLSGQAAVAIARRRLVPLLACAIMIPALAAVALHQTVPRFTATGTVLYNPNEYKPRELQSILRVDPTTAATMASEAEVLGGLRSIERVATQLDLFAKPAFNPALRPPSLVARITSWARARLGLGEPRPPDPTGEPARNAVLLAVQQALDVRAIGTSQVLEVSFTADDRVLAAAVVNRLIDVYIRDQLATKFGAVRRAQDWLEDRAAELRLEVRKG
ncbi:MAG TPA: hypothetical protein VIJ55_14955 [Acetobacteraceae bacterium]